MKSFIRYLWVILGCILIAFTLDFIIIPNNLASFGFNGLSCILYYLKGTPAALNVLLANFITLLLGFVIDKKLIKEYLLPSILIPIFIYIFSFFGNIINIEFPEIMLTIVVAGFLSGFGYSMIYKQGLSAGTVFLLEEIVGKITKFHSKIYSWFIDIIVLVLVFMEFDYQIALYSLFIIMISKYLITKARFGISDSKMFYIITSKEAEIKHFIIHDLKFELTEMDVKGGFSKKKRKILLTVVSSNYYYKLKEGVKLIDDKAFIAITDTYDVVNRRSFK